MLEDRIGIVEEVLFGGEKPEQMDTMHGKTPLARFVQDCREDIDSIYDVWGPALDRNLGKNWCEDGV